MENKSKKGNVGRKKVKDKTVQVNFYIKQSSIDKHGGIEKLRAKCVETFS